MLALERDRESIREQYSNCSLDMPGWTVFRFKKREPVDNLEEGMGSVTKGGLYWKRGGKAGCVNINHSFPRPFSVLLDATPLSIFFKNYVNVLHSLIGVRSRGNYFLIFFRDGTLLTAPIDCLLLSSFVPEKIDYNTDEFTYIHVIEVIELIE